MPPTIRRLLSALALAALLGSAACTDRYGRYDPVATGLLGAGVGAAAGLAIGASSSRPPRRPSYSYYAPPPRHGWGRPIHGPPYGYGWGHRPRYYW